MTFRPEEMPVRSARAQPFDRCAMQQSTTSKPRPGRAGPLLNDLGRPVDGGGMAPGGRDVYLHSSSDIFALSLAALGA
jgi:hypothetical protein